MTVFFSLSALSYVMQGPGKGFLYSLAYHAEAHLIEFRSEANSIPPHCSWGNHTTMQRVSVFHEFHISEYS